MQRIANAFLGMNWGMRTCAVVVLCVTTAVALPAQTFTTLHSFCSGGGSCTDGSAPVAGLVQATNGDFYGTTPNGGAGSYCGGGCGTVFRITPSGRLTTLNSFAGSPTDGANPFAGLVQATNGDFYGTTFYGGVNCAPYGCGTVFKITPSGTRTTLHFFAGSPTDGAQPYAGLVQAPNGDLYGTTGGGGAGGAGGLGGTVFKITPSGALTTLYNFCDTNGCGYGGWDPRGGLVQATNGDFYGTTVWGGGGSLPIAGCASSGCGTVFKITPSGTSFANLYAFGGTGNPNDGALPYAGLVQSANGDFYGTTVHGGFNNGSHPYGSGTVFKITPSGALTILYGFCAQVNCTDGENPYAGLVQATDGNLYGTTSSTIFKITPTGTLTTLYSFCAQSYCADGEGPQAALVQGTNGDFYGTTTSGGAFGSGTVFSLSVGLGPFVETRPTSGVVGRFVEILGTNLTGAISVSFDGTAAVFEVVASSLILTKVPAGASTGRVQVVTPSGTLSSNVPFRVLP